MAPRGVFAPRSGGKTRLRENERSCISSWCRVYLSMPSAFTLGPIRRRSCAQWCAYMLHTCHSRAVHVLAADLPLFAKHGDCWDTWPDSRMPEAVVAPALAHSADSTIASTLSATDSGSGWSTLPPTAPCGRRRRLPPSTPWHRFRHGSLRSVTHASGKIPPLRPPQCHCRRRRIDAAHEPPQSTRSPQPMVSPPHMACEGSPQTTATQVAVDGQTCTDSTTGRCASARHAGRAHFSTLWVVGASFERFPEKTRAPTGHARPATSATKIQTCFSLLS